MKKDKLESSLIIQKESSVWILISNCKEQFRMAY